MGKQLATVGRNSSQVLTGGANTHVPYIVFNDQQGAICLATQRLYICQELLTL